MPVAEEQASSARLATGLTGTPSGRPAAARRRQLMTAVLPVAMDLHFMTYPVVVGVVCISG
jgi:hypothetical protein